MTKSINRFKIILAEKNKTNKWLADKLHKDPATIASGVKCFKPLLKALIEVSKALEVDAKDMLQSTSFNSDSIYLRIPKREF